MELEQLLRAFPFVIRKIKKFLRRYKWRIRQNIKDFAIDASVILGSAAVFIALWTFFFLP